MRVPGTVQLPVSGVGVGNHREVGVKSRIETPYVPPVNQEAVMEGLKRKAVLESNQHRKEVAPRAEDFDFDDFIARREVEDKELREIQQAIQEKIDDIHRQKAERAEKSDKNRKYYPEGYVLDYEPFQKLPDRDFSDDDEWDSDEKKLTRNLQRLSRSTNVRWGERGYLAEQLYDRFREARGKHEKKPNKYPPLSGKLLKMLDEEDENQRKMNELLGQLHEINPEWRTREQDKEERARQKKEKAEAYEKKAAAREKARQRRLANKNKPWQPPRTPKQFEKERKQLQASLNRLDRMKKKEEAEKKKAEKSKKKD
jgi:hypothetical protein